MTERKKRQGTVTRWGSKGFGFIQSDGVPRDIWFHAKHRTDQEYEPAADDEVSFRLVEDPVSGTYQAHEVVLLRPNPMIVRPPGSQRVWTNTPRVVATVARAPAPTGAMAPGGPTIAPTTPTIAPVARAAAVGGTAATTSAVPPVATTSAKEPPTAMQAGVGAVVGMVEEAQPGTTLDALLDRERGALREELAGLRGREREIRQRIEQLEADFEQNARRIAQHGNAVERREATVIGQYLDGQVDALARAITTITRLRERIPVEREGACRAVGEKAVAEYERIREHAASASDELTRTAFAALEREARARAPGYAALLDEQAAQRGATVRLLVFDRSTAATAVSNGTGGGGAVLVIPVRRALLATEPGLRIACAFWYIATRAAAELGEPAEGATTRFGTVGSCFAAQLPAACGDLSLLEVIASEAWAQRRSLAALGLDCAVEMVPCGIELSSTEGSENGASEGGEVPQFAIVDAAERWLPVVATRLGLSPREMVVHIHDLGLAAPDDVVDEETESTMRELLGLEMEAVEQEHATGRDPALVEVPPAVPQVMTASASAASSSANLAARMLRKLLADRRVGGRHTRIEHAYGHHFSDEEKADARAVAEWLVKEEILLPKMNMGSLHVSINPRRLRDVGAIIEGRWAPI